MNRLPLAWLFTGCCLTIFQFSLADDAGLLGHWRFDEAQGDVAVDSSGHQRDGEIWNADWVRGEFGAALHFDGQGGHVVLPEMAELNGADAVTIDAWVYWEGTGRYPNILTGGTWSPGGLLIFIQDNQCSFRLGRPGVSATADRDQWRETSVGMVSPIQLGRWYHLAATFDRPQIKTYLNGRLAGSGTWDFPVAQQGDLTVGKWSGANSHQGLIDEVRIFRRALSADEIVAAYELGLPGRREAKAGQPAYERIPRASQLDAALTVFENDFAKLAISPSGRCTALIDKATGEDRIQRTTPLVTVQQDGKTYSRAKVSLEQGVLIYRFDGCETVVQLEVITRPQYFVFRLASVDPPVDQVTFAQLNLKSCEYVDTMSGLAADDRFGVCMRTLDLATQVQVRGNPPVQTATAYAEFGMQQARAAVVAGPYDRLRPALQDLVKREEIPHSPLGGPFALDAPENRGSYVFADVSGQDVDRWIELARRGGIQTIHLNGWQKSLGHYDPHPAKFPDGLDGLQRAVERFHAAGLKVGIHTLTGCISTNDAWVRPVPDRRLATDGTFTLTTDLNETDADVPTAELPGDYPTVWAYSSRGNCIRIDDELILYSAISHDSQPGFFQCQRGAFGTRAATHARGAKVHHLIARYGCFIPDEHSTLVDEVAEAIAKVYNTCKLDQIYMDGAEAMRGWYGIARMRQAIFTRLERPALVEASCWDHHSWPFHSRIGAWDHPKWGLKRFADDHLAAVERYRRGALLEAQLGWWVILPPARDWRMEMPDEIEYLCAKALAHDVPLSFQSVSTSEHPSNARQNEYLDLIGRYERLRLANYFPEEIKAKLREPRQEFRLQQTADEAWQLAPTDYLEHKVTDAASQQWTVNNRFAAQPVKLRIEALSAALPYDDPQAVELADFSQTGQFASNGSAARAKMVLSRLGEDEPSHIRQPSTLPAPPAELAIGKLIGSNAGDSREGAWASVQRTFEPVADLSNHDAIGLWVHGDGRGQLLNLQLTNLPEYFRTLDDHYIKLDFQGWRYFELLLRERDAAAYHDYQWPYGAHCVLHRSPLVRHVVNRLSVYVNNLPPGEDATCYLSPVRALRTGKITLHHPSIETGGHRLTFPVDLESGMYLEFESAEECRVYDERGQLTATVRPDGPVPPLAAGENEIRFSAQGTAGFRTRAAVTIIASGTTGRSRN